jgi:hypothetical protein|tara:strand:+ start:1364 stop:1951 length:588 start_codon:yes stop_codon:yes gene_type:complete
MGRRILATIIIWLTMFGTALAYTPEIDWDTFEKYVIEYDYSYGETSEMVAVLQYWVGANTDGVYGPQTLNRHIGYAQKKNIDTEFPTPPTYTFIPNVERWRTNVSAAIVKYGGPSSDVNRFLRVLQCESRGDPEAYNESSGASGLMQQLQVYWDWRAKMAGYEGASPFDPIANINTSAWLLYEHVAGGWQHWVCK